MHPAMSTSPEPMIALNRVIALIIVQRLSLRLLPHRVLALHMVRCGPWNKLRRLVCGLILNIC